MPPSGMSRPPSRAVGWHPPYMASLSGAGRVSNPDPALFRRDPCRILTGCHHDRLDNVVISRAATDIALKIMPYLGFARLGILLEQRMRAHHHTRRAETALQAVMILKRLLHMVERAIGLAHPLDGGDLGPFSFARKDRTGLYRLAIHMHETGAALAGVASPMGAGETQIFPPEVNKKRPALYFSGDVLAVHSHADLRHR